ncbi:hypothetical protein AB0C59_14950 [Streptomyces sp. NPDC048664]|uniref:hypothetical protein n=1 Tax=Streptomyces sp. NPDC048664 TaxID=3154505 RepID=UPI003439E5EB
MSEQEPEAAATAVDPIPPSDPRRDPEATAEALADAVAAGWSCVVTVGIPLCSDGTEAWFGSGTYDPLSERTLLSPPERLSTEGESDLRFASALAERLRARPGRGAGAVTFSLSVFDGKMVHGIGRAAARRVHSRITAHPERFLPPAALELHHAVGGRLAFDFSLNYRRLGDRFVDRLRSEVRPVMPSVPTGRLVDLFLRTGCVPLRRRDESQPVAGMGQVLCATPNTLSIGQHFADLSPLDGRGRIQTGPEAVPLTNEDGAYICEVTAIGRMLAMLAHAPGPADGGGVLTLSVLNTRDPGNHKIHRMNWSAGELVTALLPQLRPESWAPRPLTHWASVTDGSTSTLVSSTPDTLARRRFLADLGARVRRSSSPRRREEVVAGELERIRTRVQNADPDGAPVLLLYGPGDYDSRKASGLPAREDGGGRAVSGTGDRAATDADGAVSPSCFLN